MVEIEKEKDVILRTFNTAKVFAEQILFPLMFAYKRFQRQTNYGNENLDEALLMSEELREINRYNGAKAMSETCYDLLLAITSTIRLKKNKIEIAKLEELTALTQNLKLLFYNNREQFFNTEFKNDKTCEVLNRLFFEKVKAIIEICYINTEILMTRNKLLFDDSKDEYLSDEELKDQIKKEYIEN